MYLFFDTETTGLPASFRAPISDSKNWPRLVQLSWAWFDQDGKAWDRYDYIVRPEGFVIPEEATRIHRISHEQALAEGRPLIDVIREFDEHIARAEAVVGHNIEFDDKIIGAEMYRLGLPNSLEKAVKVCTMKAGADAAKISNGRGGFKWPNLGELHRTLLGRDFSEAHNAMVDVLACARCYFEMKRRNNI